MSEAIQQPRWKDGEELAVGTGVANIRQVLGTPENPDKVVRKKGLRVFEDMERTDAHYASVLQTRKLALLGKGYEIDPASDSPRDIEVADFVRWNLTHMRGSFFQDLYEVLDALGKGFSLAELVYARVERGPWMGKVALKALKAKDQQYFGFATDDFDNILDDGIVQNPAVSHGLRLANTLTDAQKDALKSTTGTNVNRRLPRDKFLHFVFNGRAENPYGRGLGGVCYWYSWFKTEGGFKFWLVFLEKFGSPTAVLQATEDAATVDLTKARTILAQLQQETGVYLPKGFELDLVEATRGGQAGYGDLVEKCNGEISKAVLGQTLTTEQGDRGARSLGEVHTDILYSLLTFDAAALEAAIQEQVVERIVDFNYAVGDEGYPQFRIPIKQRKDRAVEMQALEAAVRMGAVIPERYLHEELDYPVAAEGETVLSIAAQPDNAVPFPGGVADNFGERAITSAQIEPAARRRRKRETLDGIEQTYVEQARVAATGVIDDLVAQVRRSDAITAKTYNLEMRVRIASLRDVMVNCAVWAKLTGMQLAVEELEEKGVTFPAERLTSFAEGDLFPEDPVGPAEAIDLFRDRVPLSKRQFDRLVADLRRKHFTVAGIEEQSLLQMAQKALLEAIEHGGTTDTFAARLREMGVRYTGKAYGQDLGGQDLGEYHLRTVFRTNVMSAYNDGRRTIMDDPDVEDFIPFLMYSAIRDGRERDAHREMNGRIYRKDDPIWQTWYPPNGYNCRCDVVPVTREEARRLKDDQISTQPPVVGGEVATPDEGFGGL